MPKPRKKATVRKATRKTVRKKSTAKKVQLKSIEKNLTAGLKKAVALSKRETKKASAEATRAHKKVTAAEKKSNSALTKQASAEKKLAAKDSKQARKALVKAKKVVQASAAIVKKLQKQSTALEHVAMNAKCQEQKLQGLIKAIEKFNTDWAKDEKSTKHQADFHTSKKKVVATVTKVKKVAAKKVARKENVAEPVSVTAQSNEPGLSSNPFKDNPTF